MTKLPQLASGDVELPFEVKCISGNCISSIFMSITGTTTNAATNVLTESYCLGGVAPPPTAPCIGGPAITQDILTVSGSSTGQTRTDTFSGVSQLSMTKDIQGIGNTGTATITQVQDLFNVVSTPEPSTVLLLGSALLGLALLSKRRRSTLV